MANKKMKTWNDKLTDGKPHHVKKLDKKFVDIPENSMMLVAIPQIFEDYIRAIPYGKSVSLKEIRSDLAREYIADHTCPVTTGMFVRIVAEATYEQFLQGVPEEQLTPVWRVIDGKSSVAKKISFPFEWIAERRAKEGLQ